MDAVQELEVVEEKLESNVSHTLSFDPSKALCGFKFDPPVIKAIWGDRPDRSVCVVCQDLWHNMSIDQRRALVIFWGGGVS